MIFDRDFFNGFITDSNCYFAHLPKVSESYRQPELLSEHSALVYTYAKTIIQKQQLNKIIDNLIRSAIPSNLNSSALVTLISDLFYKSIAYHDLGKVNQNFQLSRMKNESKILNASHSFENQHSIIGVYIYLADFFSVLILHSQLSDEEQIFVSNVALYLSYTIFKHHSTCLQEAQNDAIWNNKQLFELRPYLSLFNISLDEAQIESYHNCLLLNSSFNFLFELYNEKLVQKENNFPLFALCKLNYSLLTASDYLATAHYMNEWTEINADFGLINDSLREKIINRSENSKTYNKIVYDNINNNIRFQIDKLKKTSNINLNNLRKCIATEVVCNVRENADRNLFYIEAPTGSGKTNVSMLALAELLRFDEDKKLNKVFYVFPFTTLITQTYKSLSETLDLKEDEIAEIHSKASFQTGKYEDDYLNYIDNLFVNYPIALLSHVRFFDVLKTNNKETNYLLHRMANSVVIIDELQSYSPSTWDKIIYFINNYSQYFNMKFIVMSATLPKIGNLLNDKKLASDFVYLIADKSIYFKNPNFCNRVKFDYSLLNCAVPDNDTKSVYLSNMQKFLFNQSENYAKNNSIYPNSVHTIIEFIFKKTASEFYSIAQANNNFFDEIFLLSGTILEPRRKEIIEKLKSTELRKKKVLLISTQVVEAGVDIDMDLGFKDKSIIDSEEQLAGRINRNVNKPQCTLFIFNYDSEKMLYGKDSRYQFAKEMDISEYKNILDTKDFDRLYNLIINKINNKNKSVFIENIHDLENAISSLNYQSVDSQLELIKSLNDSVFVPIDIPIRFLRDYISILEEFGIQYEESVSGKKVWDAYESVIQNQDSDFVKNKIAMNKLQGLISNFTFSIYRGGKDYDAIQTYGKDMYGFLYLESYSEIYSFKDGIKTEKIVNSNFM
ncbi:MAG: CRISPR-associated helicase Cas3' [Bacteroidia bacterium]|nr:CRISPR-associated helicase Cas3' [Bacteroidia bacterium]